MNVEIEHLLHKDVQKFIQDNKNNKPQDVAFKAHGKFDFPVGFLVDQVSGPKKVAKKLPSWGVGGIIFPPDISLQQCSSEVTATFKSTLVHAQSIVDLTGGFGVDVSAFASKAEKVVHIEQNEWLSKVVDYNFKVLDKTNITCLNTTAEEFIKANSAFFDMIYLDPARRDEGGGKVFKFDDCVPNIVTLKEDLFKVTKKVLVKASPMIDITQGVRELENVSKVWVIGLKNECKEVLFLMEEQFSGKHETISVELSLENEPVIIKEIEETEAIPLALKEEVGGYLYDPYTVLHKVGRYHKYLPRALKQIATNTNLFVSGDITPNFPGRIFKIEHVLRYNKKDVRKILKEKKVNIFTRNFPDKPEALKKKLGLLDGGDQYVIGFRDGDMKPTIAVCALEKGVSK